MKCADSLRCKGDGKEYSSFKSHRASFCRTLVLCGRWDLADVSLAQRSGRGSPVAFSCESSSISPGATCTRLFTLSCPLGTPMTKIAPRSSIVEYDSDGPIEGKIPRAPVSNWLWELASRTRCRHTCCSTCAGTTRAPRPLCAGPLQRSLGTKCCPSA